MTEQGLCGFCGIAQHCVETNRGWICAACYKREVDAADPNMPGSSPAKFPCRIIPVAHPKRSVFVLASDETFITLNGVLYTFDRREDAEAILRRVAEVGCDVAGLRVASLFASDVCDYVKDNEDLMMKPIEVLGEAKP